MPSKDFSSALEPFRKLIEQHSGLQIPPYRLSELQRAVAEIQTETGLSHLEKLHSYLASPAGRRYLQVLVSRMTVGETYFFRDGSQFRALEQDVLPELVRRRRKAGSLRIWSAACSTGEEPYSLAILLHRLLRRDLRAWRIMILGTDIDTVALDKARQARYRPWSLRATPDIVRSSYFRQVGELWELIPDVRRLVTFQPLNLLRDPFPDSGLGDGRFDLILCRNVLIYFDRETSKQIVDRLHGRLSDQGLLTVGFAEHQPGLYSKYERVVIGEEVFYRRPQKREVFDRQPFNKQAAQQSDSAPAARADGHPKDGVAGGSYSPRTPQFSTSLNGKQEVPGSVNEGTSARVRVDQALALVRSGKRQQAMAQLTGLLPAQDISEQQLRLVAKAFADCQDWEAAKQWLDALLARNPLDAHGHYLYGLVHQATGRIDDALTAFRRSVYLNSSFVLSHFALAGLFLQRGQHRRAMKALEHADRLLQGLENDQPVAPDEPIRVRELREMVRMQRRILSKNA